AGDGRAPAVLLRLAAGEAAPGPVRPADDVRVEGPHPLLAGLDPDGRDRPGGAPAPRQHPGLRHRGRDRRPAAAAGLAGRRGRRAPPRRPGRGEGDGRPAGPGGARGPRGPRWTCPTTTGSAWWSPPAPRAPARVIPRPAPSRRSPVPEFLGPVKGFGVTFRQMFRKVDTVQYPEEKEATAPRFHGRHQ